MKFVFSTLVALLIFSYVNSQETATVSGQIIDNSTTEGLPFTTVSVLLQNGGLVHGDITNEEGRFTISGLQEGTYTVKISYIGYNDQQLKVLVGKLNKMYDLGKIKLTASSQQLDEVTIKATRAEIATQLDKKSFNVDNMIAQSGGSVMGAMKMMPGVTFNQEGKVILRGSDKVIVLIDGKQSSLTGFGNQKGLDNIPAANIERIEIINNPSSKYDAQGMAGIINIIYKKDKEYGVNGSVGFSYGLGALSKPKADLPSNLGSYSVNPKYIPSIDFNFNKEKISFFLQSEVMFLEKLPNNEFTTRYYDDGSITASQVPENRKQIHYIIKGGLDYRFNESNTLTFSGVYDWEKHIDTAQVPYIDLVNDEIYRKIAWNEEEITGYMNYMLQYEHKFKQPGHTLSSSAQYTRGWEDETYYVNDSSAVRQGRDITNIYAVEKTGNVTVDYVKPLFSGRIETGAKFQIRNLPVEYTQIPGEDTILYPGLGNWSEWGENIYAGYFNWILEKEKYDIEAGLRAEYTTVYYDMDPANIYYDSNDAYDYFELFPNVRFSYKVNDNNRFSLFYNRRVDRPGEPELRMFSKSDDHELVKVGNPYLRPQFTQSVEAAYKTNWESGSVFISGYLRFIQDPYMRVYTIDASNQDYDIILKSYANTGQGTNKGVELVFSQQILEAWKLGGNINYYQNKIASYTGTLLFPYEHTFTIEETKGDTWDFKLINTFSLPLNFEVQLTGLYIAAKNIPQGKELSRSSIDFGVKKTIWEGKGEINFSASDIFNKYGLRQEIKGEGFDVLYENYYETQILTLGLKYKF